MAVYSKSTRLHKYPTDELQTKVTGNSVAEYIKSRRTIDKRIWEDIFVPYIDNPNSFETAVHNFIEDRNHIAHSKAV